MRVRSLGGEDPLEEEVAMRSSILPGKFHGQRSLGISQSYLIPLLLAPVPWAFRSTAPPLLLILVLPGKLTPSFAQG